MRHSGASYGSRQNLRGGTGHGEPELTAGLQTQAARVLPTDVGQAQSSRRLCGLGPVRDKAASLRREC